MAYGLRPTAWSRAEAMAYGQNHGLLPRVWRVACGMADAGTRCAGGVMKPIAMKGFWAERIFLSISWSMPIGNAEDLCRPEGT